ncbi:hypothetical protein KY320_03135 [Candidatus Woesearchaeota archaeon]|nr:hypothetical protein [Candidatus Woesearchaeota archaeon]
MKNKIAPLSGGFMAASIIGFFISAFKVYPINKSWGFAFMVVFAVLFISSLVSMTHAPTEALIAMEKKRK